MMMIPELLLETIQKRNKREGLRDHRPESSDRSQTESDPPVYLKAERTGGKLPQG